MKNEFLYNIIGHLVASPMSLPNEYYQYKTVDEIATKPRSFVTEFLNTVFSSYLGKYSFSHEFTEVELEKTHCSVYKLYIKCALYIVHRADRSVFPPTVVKDSDESVENFLEAIPTGRIQKIAMRMVDHQYGRHAGARFRYEHKCLYGCDKCYLGVIRDSIEAVKLQCAERAADVSNSGTKYTDKSLQKSAMDYASHRISRYTQMSRRYDPTYLVMYGTWDEALTAALRYLGRRD